VARPLVEEKRTALLAPELAARVKQIHIRTHRLVNTALSGGYRSTFRGQGVEFEEVRRYQPGDDVRSIDWNVTARTGEPFIKTYREERELSLALLVDTGLSMDFGSRRWTKREAAAQLASLISYVAVEHQDQVGLTLFGDEPGLHLKARKGGKHAMRVVREIMAAPVTGGRSDLALALKQAERTLHRRSLVFVFSDFLANEDPVQREEWSERLGRLARRHDVICVALTDPFEQELPRAGVFSMYEMGTGRQVEVDSRSSAVRTSWRNAALARRQRLDEVLSKARVGRIDVSVAGSLADPIVQFFHRRELRKTGAGGAL
jgi:uncharacterized protein (DUF58 family)